VLQKYVKKDQDPRGHQLTDMGVTNNVKGKRRYLTEWSARKLQVLLDWGKKRARATLPFSGKQR